jgi:biopolymer transport protein ExbB
MLYDILYEQAMAGGWVLIPIFLTGAVGFWLLADNVLFAGRDFYRKGYTDFLLEFQEHLQQDDLQEARKHLKERPGLLTTLLSDALLHLDWNENQLRNYMAERMMRTIFRMDRGMHFVGVLAATAPLLGLLGTVTGMVLTFEIITQFGNSNPVLMADGISEALITTQSGLLIAFPLVLLKHRMEDRTTYLKKRFELGAMIILNHFYSTQSASMPQEDTNGSV